MQRSHWVHIVTPFFSVNLDKWNQLKYQRNGIELHDLLAILLLLSVLLRRKYVFKMLWTLKELRHYCMEQWVNTAIILTFTLSHVGKKSKKLVWKTVSFNFSHFHIFCLYEKLFYPVFSEKIAHLYIFSWNSTIYSYSFCLFMHLPQILGKQNLMQSKNISPYFVMRMKNAQF